MKVITTNRLNRFWQKGVLPIKDALANKFDTSKILNALTATSAGYALDARQGKTLNDKITAVEGKIEDTGWVELTLKSGYSNYNDNRKLSARKFGPVVSIRGAIKNDAAFTASATDISIATIPEQFLPEKDATAVNQGSGVARHVVSVSVAEKALKIGRISSNGTYGTVTAGSWLNCDIVYFVG